MYRKNTTPVFIHKSLGHRLMCAHASNRSMVQLKLWKSSSPSMVQLRLRRGEGLKGSPPAAFVIGSGLKGCDSPNSLPPSFPPLLRFLPSCFSMHGLSLLTYTPHLWLMCSIAGLVVTPLAFNLHGLPCSHIGNYPSVFNVHHFYKC